jgi:hypothetical protein
MYRKRYFEFYTNYEIAIFVLNARKQQKQMMAHVIGHGYLIIKYYTTPKIKSLCEKEKRKKKVKNIFEYIVPLIY